MRTESAAAPRLRRPSPTLYASAAAACATFAATAWHIARNAAPPSWDDAWYMETSFRLWSALKTSPTAFFHEYLAAFRFKAPLISLVPLPFYAVFGAGERTAVWANLPLAMLAAWAWSRAAAEWWRGHPRGSDAAALGGALAALLPIAYGLSRTFLTETLVSALLGLFAWRCAAAAARDRAEGVRLGVLLGLGCLAKVTFPLIAAGFIWPARDRLKPHARLALAVGALIALTWYAENAPYVAGYAWSAGFGRIGRDYASGNGLIGRLQALVEHGLSVPLAAVMAAVAVAAAALEGPAADGGIRTALWGLAPLAVFAAGTNSDPRLPAPLLPVLALLAARAATSFPRPAARAAAVAALLGTGLWVCADQTFRAVPGRALFYNGVPSGRGEWDRGAVVDAVLADAGPNAVCAIAFEHRRLNANNLSSAAAARGMPMKFVSLGYAQDSLEAALIRLKDKSATALILVDGYVEPVPPPGVNPEAPAMLNHVNAGVDAAVRSGRLRARESSRLVLSPGVVARVMILEGR